MVALAAPLAGLTEGVESSWLALGALPLLLLFGYVFGIVPALLTGAVYGLLRPTWPRVVLSPLLGALFTLCAIALPSIAKGEFVLPAPNSLFGLMPWCGAIASLACAFALRKIAGTPSA